MTLSPFARVSMMPVWENFPGELPEGVEARKSGEMAALVKKGSIRTVGFVVSRFEVSALPELLKRLD